jgi:hypothetical protein
MRTTTEEYVLAVARLDRRKRTGQTRPHDWTGALSQLPPTDNTSNLDENPANECPILTYILHLQSWRVIPHRRGMTKEVKVEAPGVEPPTEGKLKEQGRRRLATIPWRPPPDRPLQFQSVPSHLSARRRRHPAPLWHPVPRLRERSRRRFLVPGPATMRQDEEAPAPSTDCQWTCRNESA